MAHRFPKFKYWDVGVTIGKVTELCAQNIQLQGHEKTEEGWVISDDKALFWRKIELSFWVRKLKCQGKYVLIELKVFFCDESLSFA